MKKKGISLLLVISLAVSLLCSCGGDGVDPVTGEVDPTAGLSKSDLRQAYKQLDAEYAALKGSYETLNKMYNLDTNTNNPTSEISVMGDGTGRITLNSVDSSIIFPESFQYPGNVPVAATGKLNITDNVEVTPGTNWIMKMNGSSVEMQHSGGISGTILVGSIPMNYSVEQLQYEVLEPWFQKLGVEPMYKQIFVTKAPFGVQAATPIMIDSESAYLRCGMIGYASTSLIYIFVYRGPQDTIKDESELSVINSMKINSQEITVDP